MAAEPGQTSKLGFVLLVALWFVWGSAWPAMRIVFMELPVWQFRAVTCAIGGLALLGLGLAFRQSWRVPRRQWGVLVAAAFFNMTVWHVAVGYGLSMIGAGHAAIICYTLPIWTAAFSILFLKETISWRVCLALIFGTAGMAVLLASDFEKIGANPLGMVFVLAAAIAWAVGTLIVKRVDWSVGTYALAGWQLLIGLVPIAIIAVLTERFTLHQASDRALWAALYTLLVALIAGYALWFSVVEIFPATIASLGALMIPVIGVISGAIVLGEPLTWVEGASLGLVLTAIWLVIFSPAARGRPEPGGGKPGA